MSVQYYFQSTILFPEGVHFGAGKQFNSLAIARDGIGRPVLNGTSLAGWLRETWRQHLRSNSVASDDDPTNSLFGFALDGVGDDRDDGASIESCVRVTNYPLAVNGQSVDQRTHHQRNRHRGTVLEPGLFSAELCPPKTSVTIGFWIVSPADLDEAGQMQFSQDTEKFLAVIVKRLRDGAWMGGNSNRGFGRVLAKDHVKTYRFDLARLPDHAAFLTAHRTWRENGEINNAHHAFSFTLPATELPSDRSFRLDFSLRIPRGQDAMIGEIGGDEGIPEPQRALGIDGKTYWRIPGSTLRGLFRSWFHRFAARDAIERQVAIPIADDASLYEKREEQRTYNADNLGVGFVDDSETLPALSQQFWPVVFLFGDLRNRGRIRITDGLSTCSEDASEDCNETQVRTHVAVDRVTGGAAKGLLFRNRVLTSAAEPFPFHLQIDDPKEHEVVWLARTLRALDLGILRVGSSKSAGRLELVGTPTATGSFREAFEAAMTQESVNTVEAN